MEKAESGLQGFLGRVRGFHDSLPGWLSFSGQLSRQNFLLALIPVTVLGWLLALPELPIWLSIPLGSPLVLATLGLVIKRLRDAGIHWAAAFIGFIPLLGWVLLAVFVAIPTKRLTQTSPVWKTFGTGFAAFVTFSVVAGALVPLPEAPPSSSDSSSVKQSAERPEVAEAPAGGDTPPAPEADASAASGDTGVAGDEAVADDAVAPEPEAPDTEALVEAPPAGASPAGGLEALVVRLRVEPEVQFGYDRDLFRHWIDADGDGCDSRREVLIAESTTPVGIGSGCSLFGGTWYSAFDGVTTTDASSFDIDHFVPLKEAWDSGAHAWDSGTRQRFANDLEYAGSLVAVSASSNRSKGAGDPSEWLPPNRSYWCVYLVTWVEVKLRWNLSADPGEIAAIRSAGSGC
ncbi:MAG: DUF1524 domain-containing protein [Pontimonas sp.]|nr:DUF1524 domain-containing protein [Pontimonas sp.]